MKKAFQRLTVLSSVVPVVAMADPASRDAGYSAGYKLGWYVGRFVGTYGLYLCAALLVAVVGWLWFRRSTSRRRHDGGA